ncbi:restriction endonuclease [Streptomyces sp. NBC_00334]|uniref:restriction endonuclease n=1 Tax=Streptomyces sp. NBC_00334 TaxID=2975713 RepID=UPI002E2B2FA6|nr:restriction endonuclease [Streptomyces sp. NBC_00334]
MWFGDPGHVSDVTIRGAAEKALAGMPGSVRAAWTAALEEARKDILGSGTVLESKQYTGTYDHRYDSWHMPVELGIGIDAVDDGNATVRLVQHRAGEFDTISQIVSYVNGRRLFHKVTVGEILPAGSRNNYSPEDYTVQLREADDAYRTLRAAFATPDSRTERYQYLLQLTTFLKEQARALETTAPTPTEPRAVPDWFALSPTEFEYAVAELCRKDGCTRVQAIGGAGDLGADVVAYTPDGCKVVIQCKQYRGKVASPDLQRFAGTVFNVHRADVAVLVTTGTVTTPAARLAKATGIEIVHAERLDRWADGRDRPPWYHHHTLLPPESGL